GIEMIGALAEVRLGVGQFVAVLGLQLGLVLGLLNVLMGLANDVLLAVNEGGEFIEALIRQAVFAAGQFQNFLAERPHLQKVNFRGEGVAAFRAGFGEV